jgi:hypothetical protein
MSRFTLKLRVRVVEQQPVKACKGWESRSPLLFFYPSILEWDKWCSCGCGASRWMRFEHFADTFRLTLMSVYLQVFNRRAVSVSDSFHCTTYALIKLWFPVQALTEHTNYCLSICVRRNACVPVAAVLGVSNDSLIQPIIRAANAVHLIRWLILWLVCRMPTVLFKYYDYIQHFMEWRD